MANEIRTLNDILLRTLTLDRPAAMKYKKDNQWNSITVDEFGNTVRYLSLGLQKLGVEQGDRVAIMSENRPEWSMSDFATLAAGAATVTVYPTLPADQAGYVINHSEAKVGFASTMQQLEKMLEIKKYSAGLKEIIVFDNANKRPLPEGVNYFSDVIDIGKFEDLMNGEHVFFERLIQVQPDDLATIIYTSGTTGDPKGAMLTHGNITSNVLACTSVLPLKQGHVGMSILPLSHVLERTAEFSYWYVGGTVAYAESIATVKDDLAAVKPDVFAAVPRLFEKMQARIMDKAREGSKTKQAIFNWALSVGKERKDYIVDNKRMPLILGIKSFVADALVFKKIKEALGGNLKFVLSGGAPLSDEQANFFIGAGIQILEGYGLTETSPVIAVNTLENRMIGTVGQVAPGVEVKIAADGEILARGPNIMKGYYKNEKATAECIDNDGWFATGDIGTLVDKEGAKRPFLKITDRKKDLIINSYGKNIAPQEVEAKLKSSQYIATPIIIGDKRERVTALIVPNYELFAKELKERGVEYKTAEGHLDTAKIADDDYVKEKIRSELDVLNTSLPQYERVTDFELLPQDLSLDAGEITPTMKVKRKVVSTKYKDLIDGMYA